ncbi:MAG: NAD-dependent epimerase/dehydratase family protein [Asgard group archaeon]|nr:NAD-dependent epimerase/dehydratase family protein [Asgard group archaeon]
MVVLVTGATGFLGGVLIKKLLEVEKISGKDIRVLALQDECCVDLEEKGVEIVRGDLLHSNSLKGIMKDVTTVYHNAAIVITESVSREVMMKVNYHATIDLAKKLLKEESAKKFVFASSFGVYGMKYPKHPISEEYRKNPQNNYQESKFLAEIQLQKLHEENSLDFTAIRNPLIIGPGDKNITLRLVNGLIQNKVPYLGKGQNKSSYVDARDSAQAMILSTKKSVSKGKSYNIKSFDISQKNYFDYHAKACGDCYPTKKFPVWIAYLFAWYKEKTTPKGQESLINRTRVKRFAYPRMLDTKKIQSELGFQPQHSDSEKVIHEAIQWLIENNLLES